MTSFVFYRFYLQINAGDLHKFSCDVKAVLMNILEYGVTISLSFVRINGHYIVSICVRHSASLMIFLIMGMFDKARYAK